MFVSLDTHKSHCLPVTKTGDMEHELTFWTRLRRRLCTYLTLQTSDFHEPHLTPACGTSEKTRACVCSGLMRSDINNSVVSSYTIDADSHRR